MKGKKSTEMINNKLILIKKDQKLIILIHDYSYVLERHILGWGGYKSYKSENISTITINFMVLPDQRVDK